ncbi:MAG: HD domain-containing protein [Candidatus Micrarchaeia archaeon]
MAIKRDLEFLYELGCLRLVPRNWMRFLIPPVQNVSEHSFRVTWIALYLARKEGADEAKTLKMALLHDLPESRTGDCDYITRQFIERKGDEALSEMLSETVFGDLRELMKEYEARDSLEAKIVKDADNLDVDFELREQAARGFKQPKGWKEIRDHVAENHFYTKSARELYAAIMDSDPNDWHLNASNRFKAGDWKKQ